MGLFSKDLTNFSDDAVLMEYDVVYHQQYKCHFLRTKRKNGARSGFSYPSSFEKTFYPIDVLWKDYMNDGEHSNREIQYSYGFNIKPNKNDFCDYVSKYADIEKLVFKGKTYYRRHILYDMFEHYNEHVIEKYMKESFNNR